MKDCKTGYGAGDSMLFMNILPPATACDIFARVRAEAPFQTMSHRGGLVPRLVCVMGDVTDDAEPVYRHPAEAQPPTLPWTPAVGLLRQTCSDILAQPFNHALVQFYANGRDYISEHSDKTIDVRRGSAIVNVSLGATRVLVLRPKPRLGLKSPAAVQRVALPHNSVFVLGCETNRQYTHAIRQDKRVAALKCPDELIEGGARVSLTFRDVATFLDRRAGILYGQGARNPAAPPLSPGTDARRLLHAFSSENRDADFNWDAHYGQGFSTIKFDELSSDTAPAVSDGPAGLRDSDIDADDGDVINTIVAEKYM